MKKVKVLVKEIGKLPEVREIENTLEAQQGIVGGYIEAVYIDENVFLVCNEEGKLKELEPNFECGSDVIVGNVFFVRIDDEGDNTDLTESDINKIKSKFKRAGTLFAIND